MSNQTVYLVANGDLRESANQQGEPAQAAMEAQVVAAVEREGWTVRCGHPFNKLPVPGAGFSPRPTR